VGFEKVVCFNPFLFVVAAALSAVLLTAY